MGALMFGTFFENTDLWRVEGANTYELIQEPFEITPGVILPVGAYDFTNAQVSYTFGQHRGASGSFSFRAGSFWSGNIKAVEFRQGRVEVLEQFSIEPSVSVNWVDLREGSFRTELVRKDRPLVVGDIQIQCYVLEDETRVVEPAWITDRYRYGGCPVRC